MEGFSNLMSIFKNYLSMLKKIYGTFQIKKIVSNTNKSNHNERVLISYLVGPFLGKKRNKFHTNFQEIKIISKVFDNFGFKVDAVDYRSNRKINYEKYGIIFGFGQPFENSFKFKNQHFRIFYATVAHHSWQNLSEINRVKEFNKKNSTLILPSRVSEKCYPLQNSFSDWNVILGNKWNLSTYEEYVNNKTDLLYPTSLIKPAFLNRNIESTKRSFIFLSGSGLVHKGLDLCIDYFATRPDLELNIFCHDDEQFFNAIGDISQYSNIKVNGLVNVNSNEFNEAAAKSLFTLSPSCSEGSSTSVITSMSSGLIPIVSKFVGIDTADFGFEIKDLSYSSLSEVIPSIISLSNKELQSRSIKSFKFIEENCTLEAFEENFTGIIKKALVERVNKI